MVSWDQRCLPLTNKSLSSIFCNHFLSEVLQIKRCRTWSRQDRFKIGFRCEQRRRRRRKRRRRERGGASVWSKICTSQATRPALRCPVSSLLQPSSRYLWVSFHTYLYERTRTRRSNCSTCCTQARYLLYLYSFLLYIVRSLRSVRALAVVSERDGPTAVEDGALHNVFRAAPRTKLEIGVAIAQAIDNERHTTPSNPFGVLGTVQNLATFYGFKERRLEPTARRGPGGAAAPV